MYDSLALGIEAGSVEYSDEGMSLPLRVTFTEDEVLYPDVPTRILNLHAPSSRIADIIPAGGGVAEAFFVESVDVADVFFFESEESHAIIAPERKRITANRSMFIFISLVNVKACKPAIGSEASTRG